MSGGPAATGPFCTGFLLSLSLCLDLGVVNAAVLEISLQQGGAAGFVLGAGSCAGDLVYFAIAIFGAAALLEWRPVHWALWIFGTGALLWLAWRMIRDVIHPKKPALEGRTRSPDVTKLLLSGFGMALASPTAILWFAAVGGSVIAAEGGNRDSVWVFGAGFAAAGLAWAAAFAYAAAMLRLLGAGLVRTLSLVSALLFLYFAGLVFINGLRTLF